MKRQSTITKEALSSSKMKARQSRWNRTRGRKTVEALNKSWQYMEKSNCYRKAVVKVATKAITL